VVVTSRGSSATLDVVLFVVLVGAAVTVLGGAQPTDPAMDRVAEETGDVLATATTTVTVPRSGSLNGDTVTVERQAHGTYAELLAAAAVADPTVDGDGAGLTGAGDGLTQRVRTATRRALGTGDANVEVRAVWRPYRGSALGDRVVVGDSPPRDASVSLATATVGSGFPNATSRALEAADETGFPGVARVVSGAVIRGLFPPVSTHDAFHSEGPDRVLAVDRYRHAASVLGVDIGTTLREGDITAANRKLSTALAATLRGDLRRRYESPAAAARAVCIHRVRILVRTWSP
jgi:hypothetical protein